MDKLANILPSVADRLAKVRHRGVWNEYVAAVAVLIVASWGAYLLSTGTTSASVPKHLALVSSSSQAVKPTVTIRVNNATIKPGQSSIIQWSSTNTTSCVASGAWLGNLPTKGSISTSSLMTTNKYLLSCSGPDGSSNASVTISVSAAAQTVPLLGGLNSTPSDSTLSAHGFKEVVIKAEWAAIEPEKGIYSSSALEGLQQQINNAEAVGLNPSLDIGVQYAPSWIFTVGGGTRFIDQYGDVFTGSAASGNDVPNAITDMNVRDQLGAYITYLGTHLTGLGSVRLGGSAYNEMRYPSGLSGSKPNAFWFYDASSQASLPANVRAWKPGTGSVSQAADFLNAYNKALVNYGIWLEKTAAPAFPAATKLEMLLPGWGERSGQVQTAENTLLVNTPDAINQGLDWIDLLPQLPATGRIVAYTTYADATQGSTSNPVPAVFIHDILPSSMLEGGESTGNGQSTVAGMNVEFTDAKKWDWYVVNWFFGGQSESTSQLGAAFKDD